MLRRPWMWLAVALIVAVPGFGMQVMQTGPGPEMKARIEAFFNALAGEPDAFEQTMQKELSPELLARRTPADRRTLHDRLHKELGAMTLDAVERTNDTLTLTVGGATGMRARVELDLGPEPPHRFTRMAIQVTDGPDARDAGPPVPIRGSMTPAEIAAAIDRHLARAVSADEFSGVVLVARDGVPIVERAYGLANRSHGVANTTDTRFNLASIGKAFTRAAIAQLIAQGKLSLTDTLGALIPDYPNEQTKAATVEQLLEHQAGIADFFGPAFARSPMGSFQSNADYYRFVSAQPPLFAPGARRQYCNGCYIVLGAIIERLSGQTYEDYMARHVFARAGMRGTNFLRTDEPAAKMATGYTRKVPGGDGSLQSNVTLHGVAGSAAGGSYATAADLLAFDNAIRATDRSERPDGSEPPAATAARRLLDAKMTAWFLRTDKVGSTRASGTYQIAGGAPGVSTMIESDGTWTVIVLTNVDPPAAGRVASPIMRALAS